MPVRAVEKGRVAGVCRSPGESFRQLQATNIVPFSSASREATVILAL